MAATYTVATMDVPRGLWAWFKGKLEKAGYTHVIDERKGHELLDMTHIGLKPEEGDCYSPGRKKCLVEVYIDGGRGALLIGDENTGYRLAGLKVGGAPLSVRFEVDIDELIEEALKLREKA